MVWKNAFDQPANMIDDRLSSPAKGAFDQPSDGDPIENIKAEFKEAQQRQRGGRSQ